MSAIEKIEQRIGAAEYARAYGVEPGLNITTEEFKAALAEAWDAGAAKGDAVGMDAIILNPMHANPWRES